MSHVFSALVDVVSFPICASGGLSLLWTVHSKITMGFHVKNEQCMQHGALAG